MTAEHDERYTVVLHVTVGGSYDDASDAAGKIEAAAKRAGGEDTMVEIIPQDGVVRA
jgi:hypothetical protein